MKRLIIAILLITVFLASCSERESDREDGTAPKGVYPDLIMENTTCQIGRSSGSPIKLEAAKMTLYSSDGYAELEDFSFKSIDDDGETEVEGSAKKGSVKLDGSSIELIDGVRFSRPGDKMLIEADNLVYNSDTDEITAEGRVKVNSADGMITGSNFRGDLRRNVYTFSEVEEGEFEIE